MLRVFRPSHVCFFALAILGMSRADSVVSDSWHWVADDFDVLMNTNGQISFAPYVNGGSPRNGFEPGYRSDFYAYVDFFKWKGLISTWLIANTTIIESSDTDSFKLYSIHYILTPGYRYEFKTWLISGLLLHECIHSIDHSNQNGAIWWNTFQFGFGSKAAYQQFLVDRYRRPFADFWDNWDYQFNVGAFLHGANSIWLQQNSDYRYQEFSLLRYHLGRWHQWGGYTDLNQSMWYRANGAVEQKWSITANLLLRGKANIAGLYYTYVFFDGNPIDNEDRLGSLGFKIVF